jgi:hypothetical protein
MSVWTPNHEIFLKQLKLECLEFSNYNREKVKNYTITNNRFNIPIIILSGFNSFFALGLKGFLDQDYISIINSVISLGCGILSSTVLYMKINEKINICVSCSHELNDLSANIFKELSLDDESRTMDGKDYCNKAFEEYLKIMQKQVIPKYKLNNHLCLQDEYENICKSSNKKKNVCVNNNDSQI